MEYNLQDIKHMRKQLNLTQADLAKESSISQSMIAKIESGNMDPSYSKTTHIFATLERLSSKKEKVAKDIMTKKIIAIDKGTSVHDTVQLMKKHAISQLLVLEKGNVIGLISESDILDLILRNDSLKHIQEIMSSAPPSVDMQASRRVVVSLLKHYPMITVFERGALQGVITKADILKNL